MFKYINRLFNRNQTIKNETFRTAPLAESYVAMINETPDGYQLINKGEVVSTYTRRRDAIRGANRAGVNFLAGQGVVN